MWDYLWPMLLIIASNVIYNIVTKETPENVNPFLSLVVTYLVGAVIALVLYFVTSDGSSTVQAVKKLNWTSYLLGIAIIGLEAGYLYLYRAGWKISMGSLVANISLAVILLLIGTLIYHEQFGFKQVIGLTLCGLGLMFVNMK